MSRLAELQEVIRKGEAQMELAAALERLLRNRDFILVIKDAYLKDEVLNLGLQLSSVALASPEYNELVRGMDAISQLSKYLLSIQENAKAAQEDVREARRYLGDRFED